MQQAQQAQSGRSLWSKSGTHDSEVIATERAQLLLQQVDLLPRRAVLLAHHRRMGASCTPQLISVLVWVAGSTCMLVQLEVEACWQHRAALAEDVCNTSVCLSLPLCLTAATGCEAAERTIALLLAAIHALLLAKAPLCLSWVGLLLLAISLGLAWVGLATALPASRGILACLRPVVVPTCWRVRVLRLPIAALLLRWVLLLLLGRVLLLCLPVAALLLLRILLTLASILLILPAILLLLLAWVLALPLLVACTLPRVRVQ